MGIRPSPPRSRSQARLRARNVGTASPGGGRARPLTRITLSDDWRAWIVENAVRGADRATLTGTLVEAGIAARLAADEVDAILASPAMPGCRRLHRRVERLVLVARLLRAMAAQGNAAAEVERRETVGADEFYDRYYGASRPVVLTRILDGWPALSWTPEMLAERFGDVEIDILAGRGEAPEHDHDFQRHRATVTMAEYVRRVRAAGLTNDLYLVANNRVLEKPELAPLLAEITPPADIFDTESIAGRASLWFGPGGTCTPLHHDTTNILFCQLHGRKRIDLVSPLETSLLDDVDGFYAGRRSGEILDEGADEGEGAPRVLRVELSAGEALFLPAGWWHEVTALETSLHVSLLAFRRSNEVDWYRPGRV